MVATPCPSPDTAVHVAISWARLLLPAMVWALFLTLGRGPPWAESREKENLQPTFYPGKKMHVSFSDKISPLISNYRDRIFS